MSELERGEKKPGLIKTMTAVARVTFREVTRDRVLYNTVLVAVLLLSIGVLAAKLTSTKQYRIVIDFGLAAVGISCTMISIFVGSGLLAREFDRRTIYVALSRPITRYQFLMGKFLGMVYVLALNWVLLSLAFLAILWQAAGPDFSYYLNATTATGLFLVLIQSFMALGLALMISAFSTTSLAVICSIGIYLVGNNISQLRTLATKSESPASKALIEFLAGIFPNFENFSLGLKATYALPVSGTWVAWSVAYGFLVTAITLLVSGILIEKRES